MKPVPRISTRGYFDLRNGNTLKTKPYHLYPKKDFEKLAGCKELVVMIHGLRNDNAGAIAKIILAKKRLRELGYVHPVVGYSYDSNVVGAHLEKNAKHVLATGQKIAKKNGCNLAKFIEDFKTRSPETKIRLMGHSLGSQVILSALECLAKNRQNSELVEGVYFFGASIGEDIPSSKKYGTIIQNMVNKKIVNHYAPTDEVLAWADNEKHVKGPLGLNGAVGKTIKKYSQKKVKPKNHRFASYADVLNSFP